LGRWREIFALPAVPTETALELVLVVDFDSATLAFRTFYILGNADF
jgi:hypothetical protein